MSAFYLASKSPRRKEILEQLGFTPIILASNDHTLLNFAGDEEQLPDEPRRTMSSVRLEKKLSLRLPKSKLKSSNPSPFYRPIPR